MFVHKSVNQSLGSRSNVRCGMIDTRNLDFPSTAKKTHETQNQPNRLVKESSTNPCVCM